MEHESFSDQATAAVMNELFVNVKVDREERPDVDAHDDGRLRDDDRAGRLADDGVPDARRAARSTQARTSRPSRDTGCRASPSSCRRSRRRGASAATTSRRRPSGSSPRSAAPSRLDAGDAELTPALLDAAERGLARDYEPAFGGFGTAPKFPPASALEFLLRRGGPEALGMVRRTLDGMAAGGLYDVVGGGFHRYSVDARWLVPHFEKMLYDNALLVSAYLHAWVVTGEERDRRVVEETVDYLLREMRLESGGLASAQDADTDGVEGVTYTWTPEEWEGLGLEPSLLEPFEHGRCIVRGELEPEREGTAARSCARSARSRFATTRRSPRGTASRWRRSRRPGGASTATTGSPPRSSSASSCSPSCVATTVACSAACATVA